MSDAVDEPAIALRAYSQISYVRNDFVVDEYSRRANDLIFALKNSKYFNPSPGITKSWAAEFADHTHDIVGPWFSGAVVFPLPGSGKSPPTRLIEKTVLLARGLVSRFGGIQRLDLVRTHAIQASHEVQGSQRPTVAIHAESLGLQNPISPTVPVVLIDDVLTRGATAIAATKVLRDAGHQGMVSLVCAAHTRLKDEVPEEHVEWKIEWLAGQPYPTKHKIRVYSPR